MLTRRATLSGIGAIVASGAHAASPSTIKTAPSFKPPKGACDCHVHVIPDPAKFPMAPSRAYTPPVATAKDLQAFHKALGIERAVVVTPSIYGPDNRATLDALKQLGLARTRGVITLGPQTSKAQLFEMYKLGVRGARVNLESNGVADPTVAIRKLEEAIGLLEGSGWHMQLYARMSVVAALAGRLATMPIVPVFDHFAGAKADRGADQEGFDAVLSMVRSGHAYVKISGAYRVSDRWPDFADTIPLARALVAANPDRILWGSDWPHTGKPAKTVEETNAPIPADDGALLNLLAESVPDQRIRHKILVNNPSQLYGF